MFVFSSTSMRRMQGCNPKLVEIAHEALSITLIDFGVPEFGGLRSVDDQKILFERGVSKADGTEKKSYHQTGNALDFFALDPDTGRASWDPEHLAMVACAFLQAAINLGYKVEWGGLWRSFKDMPHIQLVED